MSEKSSQDTKACPYCGETILAIAKKCRFCMEFLDETSTPPNPHTPTKSTAPRMAQPELPSDQPRFVDNCNGTVTDTQTGLTWAAKDNEGDSNWENAKQYCENYRGGGHSDWRMPTVAELQSLYDSQYSQNTEREYAAHLLTPLIHLSCPSVWSIERMGGGEPHRRSVDFDDGGAYHGHPAWADFARVLPVRSQR